MQVHATHGVLADWQPDRWADRLYVPQAAFARWLDDRPTPYRSLDTLEPGQVALTVDDATNAGAAACLAARERGHEVTFFVNPLQIISTQPYYFTLLNLGIDGLVARDRRRLSAPSDRSARYQKLRTSIRMSLRGLDSVESSAILASLFETWGINYPDVPEQHLPISLDTLQQLVAAGVTIGNHGWSHRGIAEMDEGTIEVDVAQARLWLMQRTGQNVFHYAVPFGIAMPSTSVRRWVPGLCVLLDAARDAGRISERLINRVDITPLVTTYIEARLTPPSTTPRLSAKSWALTGLVVVLAIVIILGLHLAFFGRLLHSS